MDAQLVWDTWRRILRDDDLVACVTHPEGADGVAVAGLDAAERAVVADYALTPQATETNIGMYRRGIVRNALAALSRVPLSQHLLYMSGLDVDDVAADFAHMRDHADDGPSFWRLAGAFVDYLATRPELAEPVWQDVLALDRALVGLARRLGVNAVALWPDTAVEALGDAARPDRAASRFVASRAAVVAGSRHDLTPWIENPQRYDPAEALEPSPCHWLIYFPFAESDPAYAELSERSARIFDLLATPKTAHDVAGEMGSLSAAETLTVIDGLAELGAVVVSEGDGLTA
jgi:hypothetical protein